jgi:hypothetical protein
MSTCGELGCGCSNECIGRHEPSSSRHLTFSCYITTPYILLNPLVYSSLISLLHLVSEIDIKLLQEILFFYFSWQSVKYPWCLAQGQMNVQYRAVFFYKFECEFRYLKDWWCSLYIFWNNLPVCPVYFLPQYGQMTWYIPQLLSLPISPMFCMSRFSLCY